MQGGQRVVHGPRQRAHAHPRYTTLLSSPPPLVLGPSAAGCTSAAAAALRLAMLLDAIEG